jgi:hypothetical protein
VISVPQAPTAPTALSFTRLPSTVISITLNIVCITFITMMGAAMESRLLVTDPESISMFLLRIPHLLAVNILCHTEACFLFVFKIIAFYIQTRYAVL